ncbi:PREDICTED: prolow-density lipoprotein receptor-related protein 1-like [Ceratosolen solmsi marchali]|uniref:Prolow-density lipoprotein receptor-related protein 1-like n=1 Tax=Ceratosolen solmsi marchali TaxID=326594 RepID=A0AAJ7DZW6_9HYME|nr:PREDICTED: prolow-density lipoprotein receptor-related protein 1-like [Ceratosolen solmsi marchali]
MNKLLIEILTGLNKRSQYLAPSFVDCVDQSDESIEICQNYVCPNHTFKCSYGGCIHDEIVCDGIKDCIDGKDEAKDLCTALNCKNDDCRKYTCKNDEFSCENTGQCIPMNKVCDGTHQCQDATDEKSDICKNRSCSKDYFRCAYGGCVPSSSQCNLRADCYDWSDEDDDTCGNSLPEGACNLPLVEPGTWYNVGNCERCRPGSTVPELTRLEFNCYGNTSIEGASIAYCQGSRWLPSLPTCLSASSTKKCPIVNSPGAIQYCEIKQGVKAGLTSCNHPASIGTRISLKCHHFYERERGSSHITCLHDGTWSQIPLSCRPTCGIRTSALATMIIRGWKPSPKEDIPWHATLFSYENGLWNFFCGGTLITEKIVLTAGHCIWKTSPDTIKVLLDSNSSNFTNQNKETQIRDIDRIELHGSYQDYEGNYGSDLALLIFKNPALINPRVLPACIDWSSRYDVTQRIGEVGFIAGMGVTENDTFSSNLRIVSAQIISEDVCRKKEMPDFRKYLTYTSFCAGWANGTAVCNGDSGGGFLLQRPNTNIWEVHGIVSLSPRRLGGFLCDPNYYTVFTKIGKRSNEKSRR